jgi:hypothetical protein
MPIPHDKRGGRISLTLLSPQNIKSAIPHAAPNKLNQNIAKYCNTWRKKIKTKHQRMPHKNEGMFPGAIVTPDHKTPPDIYTYSKKPKLFKIKKHHQNMYKPTGSK